MTVKDGLVWYWDLDSADAAIVDQHSGLSLSRVGTTTTVTNGAPDGGNCVSVGNGVGKYRNSSVPKTVNYDAGFSLNIWAYSTSDSSVGNWLISHRNDASLLPNNHYFQLVARIFDNTDYAGVASSAGATYRNAIASPALAQNQWHMFTVVDNGATTSLYRNGELAATGSTTLTTRDTGAAAFSIGGESWVAGINASTNHRGRVSMAGVWDRPLTADEITWLYNSGAGRRYNSLQFGERDVGGEVLWICPSLDDIGNGTLIARDLTTNRNHGILTNMDVGDWVADTGSGGVRALDFDGVNDVITLTNLPVISTVATQSYWFKRNATFSHGPFIGFGVAGTDTNRFVIQPWTDGNVYISFNGSVWAFFGSNDINWHHLLVQYDGSQAGNSSRVQVWLDGVAVSLSFTGTVPSSIGTYTGYRIGRTFNGVDQFGSGRIDDIRIFPRNLSSTERTALASQRGYQPPAYTGLGGEVLWICPTLDSLGNGTLLARDLTYQRRHGTLTNMDPATDWVADTANGGVRALDFDGVNDRVITGLSFNIGSSPFSLAAWVNGKNINQASPILTSRPLGFNSSTQGVTAIVAGNFLTGVSGKQASFGVFDTVSRYRVVVGPDVFTDNNLHYIVGTWDGTVARLFYDGQEVSTTLLSAGSNIVMRNTGSVVIGAPPEGIGALNGVVDDCRVFFRTLTPTEVATLFSKRGYQPITSVRRRRNIGSHGL